MSDLGRLFMYRSMASIAPLENFTTTALAMAIRYDPRPMIGALKAVEIPGGNGLQPLVECPEVPLAAFDLELSRVASAVPSTQTWLEASGDRTTGYIDLELRLASEGGDALGVIWIEAKVDANESGSQLCTYARHAALHDTVPRLVVLARAPTRDGIPFLSWSDLVDAWRETADADSTWSILVEFLLEERIASVAAPVGFPGKVELAETAFEVNGRSKARWPDAVSVLSWRQPGRLRTEILKLVERLESEPHGRGGEVVASGGLLRWGIRPDGDSWVWTLYVTPRNHQRVPLEADDLIRVAEEGQLPAEWVRREGTSIVLERTTAADGRRRDQIVDWFDAGLAQLERAGVIALFLERYRVVSSA